jgi:guanylate kinase
MNEFLTSGEIGEFKHLIENYQMNDDAKKVFTKSSFANIAGPTGAGKDTIRNLLIEDYPEKYAPVLSTTTRPPRQNERDGVDYHFKDKQEVKTALKNGEFFQSALVHNQQISCLHISEITKLDKDQIGLSILIVQTDLEMREVKPDIKTVFIVPPTLDELKIRMIRSRKLSDEEAVRRLQAAKNELQIAADQKEYYCLINDQLSQALRSVREFFENGKIDEEKDDEARQTITKILKEL